ncbi:unnamed protein product [Closterium sp. NIES-53]
MARHHAQLLLEEYPEQLWPEALPEEDVAGVHDIRDINEWVLGEWGQIDLVVAGWECQGYSQAGGGRGMEDPRGATFKDLKRVLEMVQKKQGEVLYILENVDLAKDRREPVRLAFEEIVEVLGRGVSANAAELGSRAHRPRRYWPNGISIASLRHSLAQMQRPELRLVSDILEPNRLPAPVTSPDHPSQYQCNLPGKPRQALPTLVAYEGAQGFKMEEELPGPGMIYDVRKGRWEEPTANEREEAMGHIWGATEHPEVTERQRRAALGKAMDVNVMMWLIETIRIQLKARDLQRDIVLSERVREHEVVAQHKRVLEEMEESGGTGAGGAGASTPGGAGVAAGAGGTGGAGIRE